MIDKASTPAVEIGPTQPPSTSPIEKSSPNTASNVNTGNNSVAANNGTTVTTTSNQSRRVVGFRYYRDLGQN